MTMGIVLVACLAARIAGGDVATRTSTLSCTSSATKAWDTVRLSLNVAILNQDVFSLDITEIAQPLPECLDLRPGIVGIASRCHKSYPRDFRRLLRLGGQDKAQRASAPSAKPNDFSLHVLFLCLDPLVTRHSIPSHLITLSARHSTDCGIVRPICFRRLEIDHQLEFRRLLHGKVGGLGAFQNLIDVHGGAAKKLSASLAE